MTLLGDNGILVLQGKERKVKIMTIKELYEWAKENNVEEQPFNIYRPDGMDSVYTPPEPPKIEQRKWGKIVILYPKY